MLTLSASLIHRSMNPKPRIRTESETMSLRPSTLTVLAIVTFILLSGCISPYHMEIAQGNIITQDMLDQLRPGMTRSQVRFILGTPMVSDRFHADRWDYYYSLQKSTETTPQTRHVTVNFKNDLLANVEGTLNNKPSDTSDASKNSDKP